MKKYEITQAEIDAAIGYAEARARVDAAVLAADLKAAEEEKRAASIATGYRILDRVRPGWRTGATRRAAPKSDTVRVTFSRPAVGLPKDAYAAASRAYRSGTRTATTADSAWVQAQIGRRRAYLARLCQEAGLPTLDGIYDDATACRALSAQLQRKGL